MSSFLFGKTNYTKNFISDAGAKTIDRTFEDVDAFRTANNKTLAEFEPESKRLYGLQSNALNGQVDGLGKLFNQSLAYDPYADRSRQLGIDLQGLERGREILSGAADSATKAMLARLGISGGRGGSYQSRLISGSVGSQLNPVIQSIFGGLNSGVASAGNLRFTNAQNAAQTIRNQNGLYDNLRQQFMAPMDARARSLGYQTGALGDLANAAKTNFAGMTASKKAGLFDIVKGINNMTNDLVGTVGNIAGIAGSFMGGAGGGMGGMMGGGGGKGGGSNDGGQFSGSGNFPGNATFTAPPLSYDAPPASYGNYAPASVTYSNASAPRGAYGNQDAFNSPSFTQRKDSGYSWGW